MKSLKQKHLEFITLYKKRGGVLLSLACPTCSEKIETPAAPAGESWNSLSNCPSCEKLYMKIVTHSSAAGVHLGRSAEETGAHQ